MRDCEITAPPRPRRQAQLSGPRALGIALASLAIAACSGSGPAPSPTASESPWSAKCATTPRELAGASAPDLTIVAEQGAAACGFDTTRLVAPVAEMIAIDFIDRDSALPHNFAVYGDPDRRDLIATTAYLLAPQQETLELVRLQPGTYYFLCDSHARTMFGTLTVGASPS